MIPIKRKLVKNVKIEDDKVIHDRKIFFIKKLIYFIIIYS